MHVVIIGGGVGGLALAHGLLRRGVEVSVHERDARPDARWEGYRIHIDPHGVRAFRTCLPAPHREVLHATAGHERVLSLVTEQLAPLVSVSGDTLWPSLEDGSTSHLAVDRAVLRRVLLTGLDDVVHPGAEFIGYTQEPDGRVTAEFADGRQVTGDVLVGADGAGSRVAGQRLPGAARSETGAVGIGHKIPLTPATRAWLPEVLTRGMTVASPPGPGMLFTAAFDPPAGVTEALAAFGVPDPPTVAPYVLAALVVNPAALPPGLVDLEGDALNRGVDAFVADWHPALRRLLAESDPGSRGVQTFRASDPAPDPWTPSRVTLLGDAVHQMPPVGGMGGNTALRDAALLTRVLTRAAAGVLDPVAAIGVYEREMRDYGFATVREALTQQRRNTAGGVVSSAIGRTFLRACDRVPALRDRVFAPRDPGRVGDDAEDLVGARATG